VDFGELLLKPEDAKKSVDQRRPGNNALLGKGKPLAKIARGSAASLSKENKVVTSGSSSSSSSSAAGVRKSNGKK